MIKIEIQDEHITETTRKGYVFYEQTGWAIFKDADGRDLPHPERIVIQHRRPRENEQVQPHKIGHYILDPRSLYKNNFSQVSLGTLHLIPVQNREQKAA